MDTSGAFCGIGAEERGQGQAIAENLMEMMTLKTPVISILIGEGGSGGALALAVADRVWMLENSIYSVISPEGCASILWKDAGRAAEAAESLKLTARDAFSMPSAAVIWPFSIISRIFNWSLIFRSSFQSQIFDFFCGFLSRYFASRQLIENIVSRSLFCLVFLGCRP